MVDLELYDAILSCKQNNIPVILITIVETQGSTPRKAGAKMVVFPDGKCAGTIGGGCVEAQLKGTALRALHGKKHANTCVVRLNEKIGQNTGDVCGGRLTVLMECIGC